jgi:GAF domain-containing protein/phosphoserine phosphatase RsbU-like protein
VNGTVQDFRAAYAAAFRSYVDERTEINLLTAYELGRDAVVRDLSVLDLTLVHHDALLDALREAATADVEHVTRAAAAFVLESLSAFEMVRRGFNEAREAALLERRQAAMLRQLSNFLADISLALANPDPLEEMLQLVAEQARELVGCDWCRVSIAVGPDEVREAISDSEKNARTFGPSHSCHRGPRGATTGISAATSDDLADFRRADTPMSSEGRTLREESLAAPLTALDGRAIGSLELACKREGDFSGVDEAVLANLAQMVSAAVERTRLYRRDT